MSKTSVNSENLQKKANQFLQKTPSTPSYVLLCGDEVPPTRKQSLSSLLLYPHQFLQKTPSTPSYVLLCGDEVPPTRKQSLSGLLLYPPPVFAKNPVNPVTCAAFPQPRGDEVPPIPQSETRGSY
jgi:hypothetical protein